MATNFEQVRSIFMAALERPAGAWDAYLAEACGADAGLRERVEALLDAHRHGVGLLGPPALAAEATVAGGAAERAGTVVAGRYKLEEAIGEGGMGVVWLAQQSSPVKRKVALKLIRPGMDSRQVLNRFEAERQALALMDHPNIAKVLDGGLTEEGRPFFVMELVRGTPITAYCDARRLSLKERLELFVPVCQAIQHAHQKGIIHRDIKPSNVLIALYDDRPVPKVIDFGVAKATGRSLSEETLNTAFGGVIGTPQYMSPEQATLNNLDIDTRSDVYSLGVLLYELLTGSPPFGRNELERKGLMEMLRVVREEEPPKPSTRLSTAAALPTLAANRSVEPKRLSQMLRTELDWIVLKALEKNRARRYGTASELSADVQHYLCGNPVSAHPPSAAYRMKKFVRRYSGQVIAASLVLIALLAGIAGTSFGLMKANRFADAERLAKQEAKDQLARVIVERDAKEAALKESESITAVLVDVFESPAPFNHGPGVRVVELLDGAARRLESELAGQPARRAALQVTLGRTYNAMGLPRQAIALHEQARDYFRVTLGPEHHSTRAATLQLAASYGQAGRMPEAIKLQSEVLATPCKVCGPECKFTLWATSDLAQSYLKTGRVDEGIEMLQNVLPLRRKVCGPEDVQTMVSASDLANGYILARRWPEAIQLLEELLPLSRKVEGPQSAGTLMLMNNLATSYRAVGRRDEAIKLLEQALPLSRKLNGREHPDTLLMMRNLAIGYSDLRRTLAAVKLLEEMLPLCSTGIEAGPNNKVSVMNHLGVCYAQVGRWGDARTMLEEALRLSDEGGGSADDAHGRKVRNDLGWLLTACPDPAVRDPKRAVELLTQAVKAAPDDPNQIGNLGAAQYRAGDYPAAAATLEKAIRLRPDVGFFLAMAHWKLGDKQQARADFDRVVGWIEKNQVNDEELTRFKQEAAALLQEK